MALGIVAIFAVPTPTPGATQSSAPALTIAQSADVTSVVPGGTVHYTITVTDSGQTSYPGATLTDSLTGVLDDATYNNDARATAGSVSFTTPNLTWTGALSSGQTATITYSVTVHSSANAHDATLTDTVTSPTPGNNCPTGSTDPHCSTTVTVAAPAPVATQSSIPALTIATSADAASVVPGGTVHYTITVADTGRTAYPGATLTDPLTGVLDDATYNYDARASAGTVSFTTPNLTWTGALSSGQTATITYSVIAHSSADTGDATLTDTVTSPTPGNNCPSGSADPHCSIAVAVAAGSKGPTGSKGPGGPNAPVGSNAPAGSRAPVGSKGPGGSNVPAGSKATADPPNGAAGVLSITVPVSADLGTTAPGRSISAALGIVEVTDNRASPADWTATVSSTDFTTGDATAAETIPVADVEYLISGFTDTTGSATLTPASVTVMSGSSQDVVAATNVVADNSASWNPQIEISVPDGAIDGDYTATITQSVS
jgi:uncharacterized repeat protein (TIGR01451 family)